MNETVTRKTSRGDLVAGDPVMREILSVLDTVASSTCTVLITGESGTGKELAVAALHASGRARGPLLAVNCGAIAENLVESELFGHAKGAFTGATDRRGGVVAAAENGTLFLDEIGELSLPAQVKLLRLLQAKEFTVLGETRVTKSNARIVAATNRDLEAEVKKGRFREDLYHRLNVIQVELPPLRKRRGDLAPLAHHFLRLCALRADRPDVVGFTQEAIAAIEAHDWPGNIRALENAIERAVLLTPSPIVGLEVLRKGLPRGGPPAVSLAPPSPRLLPAETGFAIDLRATVEAYETKLILRVLESVGWNQRQAAVRLGIQRTTLIEMMKRKRLVNPNRSVA